MNLNALGKSDAPRQVKGLYSLWTGDGMNDLKRAEKVAWHIESSLESSNARVNQRLGCEADLVESLGTGVGVVREALEILDLKGICVVQRGPGGGVFVARPCEAMTAQVLVNYLLRSGITGLDLQEAEVFMVSIAHKPDCMENPAIQLFAECLRQLKECLPKVSGARLSADGHFCLTRPLSDIAFFNWKNYSGTRLSVAKKIGWEISQMIANGRYAQRRIGSEEELCNEYGVSRASMRKAVRLMEAMGVIECRPGRGLGLFVSAPNRVPVVRVLNSYLLGVRLSEQHWRSAIQIFGSASLMSLMADQGNRYDSLIETSIQSLDKKPVLAQLDRSRVILKSTVEMCGNGIFRLFWLGMAGYTFRTARAEKIMSTSDYGVLPECVLDMLGAILSRNQTLAIGSYQYIFTNEGRYQVVL